MKRKCDIFVNDAMIITKCDRSSVDPVDQYYLNVWPLLTILINIQDLNALDFFQRWEVLKARRMALKGLLFRKLATFVIVFNILTSERNVQSCEVQYSLKAVACPWISAASMHKYNKIDPRIKI